MAELILEKGWMKKQIELAAKEYAKWPKWMRDDIEARERAYDSEAARDERRLELECGRMHGNF